MSKSSLSVSSHTFVNKLLSLDNEMNAEICGKDKSADEIYQIYFDRLSLYEKLSILPLNESDKLLLQDKKEDIYVELKLFKFKQDMKEQLDEVVTQLNDLKKNLGLGEMN
ncbi:hypothetical protein [Candidatus Nitrosocosmicus sp. T]